MHGKFSLGFTRNNFDHARGGARVTRRRDAFGSVVRCVTCNVTSLSMRWQATFAKQADFLCLTETRVDMREAEWLGRAAATKGWQVTWSGFVPLAARTVGGGMLGRSGGTAILAGKGWSCTGALDDLKLLAPKQHYATGIYEAASGIGRNTDCCVLWASRTAC